jgi:hypothetical protein
MSYFKRFPKIAYDFNREGVVNRVVDIFRQVRPLQNYVDSFTAYRYTNILDGERPDILSKKLYDTPDYYWTFFLINDFLHDGLGSWPMSIQTLESYIKTEYNGYALETRPNIKYDTDGGIEKFENSLAGTTKSQNQGAFTPGTTVTLSNAGTQTATGTIRRKDIYLNQLVIQDVTGTPISDGTNIKESCVGQWTDPVSKAPVSITMQIHKAWKYADAPHHYYITGDADSDRVTNPDGSFKYGVEAHVSSANFFSITDDATSAERLIQQEGSTAAAQYKSNRSYLFDKNEEHSKIRIIDPAFITKFVTAFESLLDD